MEKRFPFPIIEIHSDNGVEFINAHLLKYCQMTGKKFTRSRPYRKNDNCYIEQKNGSIIRKFVGHARYTTEEELNILNELYGYLRLYVNFFQPTMKLIKKERIGSKVKRKYDTPKTPFQRILSSPHISEELKESLKKEYQSLNIAELWKKIYKYANQILDIAEKRKGTCINEKILEEYGIETKVRQEHDLG
jgi:transposase InsO family protein